MVSAIVHTPLSKCLVSLETGGSRTGSQADSSAKRRLLLKKWVVIAYSGSPTHLLLTSRCMSVGEPDYYCAPFGSFQNPCTGGDGATSQLTAWARLSSRALSERDQLEVDARTVSLLQARLFVLFFVFVVVIVFFCISIPLGLSVSESSQSGGTASARQHKARLSSSSRERLRQEPGALYFCPQGRNFCT